MCKSTLAQGVEKVEPFLMLFLLLLLFVQTCQAKCLHKHACAYLTARYAHTQIRYAFIH